MDASLPLLTDLQRRSAHSVLVVDDNPASKYAMARTLRASGFQTVEAGGGAEALELSEFVSAVVIDVNLPDLNGFEVCRMLRARASTALLPVIHVSARPGAEIATHAAEAGSDQFLRSPVDGVVLTRILDELLALQARRSLQDIGSLDAGERSGLGAQGVLDQMTRREKASPARRL
ncbi:MAG TPA: response regulator [Ramlibacter sp.]|jgi:CheY-like chemotaxis protein|nr:response regulator [Ramlibacter sp.]